MAAWRAAHQLRHWREQQALADDGTWSPHSWRPDEQCRVEEEPAGCANGYLYDGLASTARTNHTVLCDRFAQRSVKNVAFVGLSLRCCKCSGPSSASPGLADYSELDMLGLWYESINLGAGKSPGSPIW